MKELNIKTAVKKYNDLMMMLGYEYNTIGTDFSEDTENWNLRDMVSEARYILETYYEEGHCNCDMRYDSDKDVRRRWKTETTKLRNFIEKYKSYIVNMKCTVGHSSCFD